MTEMKLQQIRKLIVPVLAFMALAAAVAFFYAARWYVDNRLPAFHSTAIIKIRPETDAEALLNQVDSLLRPVRPASIRRAFAQESVSHHLCPGSYIIDSTFSARRFARTVTRGWENPVNLVLSGRMRSAEVIAGKISRQMMVDSVSMLEAFRNEELMKKFGSSPDRLFEFILPDTYQMYWTATPEVILERFKAENEMFWNDERRQAAKNQGLTPREAVILASIVSEESSRADEYPKIASVYLTRLRKGMKLQACPTVCYLTGYTIRRVLNRHLAIDSPFNTYMYAGLPPAPIAVPGKDHIDAVLHPDNTPYLYFCADYRFNGRNVFSRTFAEHQANAELYREALSEYLARKEAEGNLPDTLTLNIAGADPAVADE